MVGGGGGGGGVIGDCCECVVSTDCVRDMGSVMISIMGGPSFTEDTTEGSTECWVGVGGEESTMEDCDISDCSGEFALIWVLWSGGTEVVSESIVYSDGALVFNLTGVDVLPGGRALDGLAVLVLGAS